MLNRILLRRGSGGKIIPADGRIGHIFCLLRVSAQSSDFGEQVTWFSIVYDRDHRAWCAYHTVHITPAVLVF